MGNERVTHNVALFGGIFNVADISETFISSFERPYIFAIF